MFSIDLTGRGESDIVGIGCRSMIPKPSGVSSGAGAGDSTQMDVVNLLSDGEGDDGLANEDEADDEDDAVLVVNGSVPANDCVLVDHPYRKDRDINDNTGGCAGKVMEMEKRPSSMFERRSYQSDRTHIPTLPSNNLQSDVSGTGASFSRLSIYRKKSIHMPPEQMPTVSPPSAAGGHNRESPSSSVTPRKSSACGIILNRSYNKMPSASPSTAGRSVVDDVQPVQPEVHPWDHLTLSGTSTAINVPWHNLHGDHERARSSMSKSSRSQPLQRSSFLRRSFHKETASPSTLLTIDLEAASSEDIITISGSTSSGCDPVQAATTQPTTSANVVIDLVEEATSEEVMEVVDDEEITPQVHPDTVCLSSSKELVHAQVHQVDSDSGGKSTPPAEMGEMTEMVEIADTTESAEDAVLKEYPEVPASIDNEEADGCASSMRNSYGDVSSSCCLKHVSTRDSVGHRQGVKLGADGMMNEFDLLLLKINETMPPMSHKDRIDQWRVTVDDLMHSIPTKAAIETTSTSAKRPLHDDSSVHVSSDDDSDHLDATTDGPSCTRVGGKKRRTLEGEEQEQSEHSTRIHDDELPPPGNAGSLDFRKSQINPEIDKSSTDNSSGVICTETILVRKNYHKLPARYRAHDCCPAGTHHNAQDGGDERKRACGCNRTELLNCDQPGAADTEPPGTPYANLLSRDVERDKFLSYLKISPYFRTDEKALAGGRASNEHPSERGSTVDLPCDINEKLANIRGESNRLKPPPSYRANKRQTKEKRKKLPKNKSARPSVIASSGLRGVRRLVLNYSLRSGKVIRYRNNVFNTLAKAKRRLSGTTPRAKKTTPAAATGGSADNDSSCADTPAAAKQDKKKAAVRSASFRSQGDTSEGSVARQQRRLRRSASEAAMSMHPQQLCSPAVPSTSSVAGQKSSNNGRCSVDSAVSSSTSAEMRHVQKQSKECQTTDVLIIDRPEPNLTAVVVNEGKRLRNPLSRTDGEVLHVFLIDEQLIVVQKESVSFWKYSRLGVLLGVKQDWQRVGKMQRWNRDTEVDTRNANRIVFNLINPVYLEPRARNLNDDKSRACPLASIYVNAYFVDLTSNNNTPPKAVMKGCANLDDGTPAGVQSMLGVGKDGPDMLDDELLRMKSYQLDTVKSALEDIRLVPLPNTHDFIVCWHEHISEMESRTGLCKYSLTPDLDSLGCIREFAIVKHRLNSLRCINDRKLLGLGQSTVHIWCFQSGYLLTTVDLKMEIGLIMGAFMHIEAEENTLIMLQLQEPAEPEPASNNRKLVKVIAVNLHKPSWYEAHSYEIELSSMSITGESPIDRMDESNATARHCVTFDSGELLVVSLADPTACWTNHRRLEKELQRAETEAVNICSRLRSNGSTEVYRPRERILNGFNWNGGRDLVFLSEQLLTIKTIDEYMMERAKER